MVIQAMEELVEIKGSGLETCTVMEAGTRGHGTSWAITGLHMHIGSGTDLEHLAQVCGALEKAALANEARLEVAIRQLVGR